MSDSTAWLPALVLFSEYNGDWQSYLDALYEYFLTDFTRSKPSWPERRWAMKRHPKYQGKEATFWHIISEGKEEISRNPNLRRCERIRWPRRIIDAFQNETVRMWRTKRKRSERILLTTADFSYVVVLEDRTDFIMLWTAYPVQWEHARKKMRREYEAWKASEKAETAQEDGFDTPSTHGR